MHRLLKPCIFLVASVPFVYVVWQIALLQSGSPNDLGADPAQAIVAHLGEWAIRLLVLTLVVTPVRKLTGWNRIQQIRRMLGLFTFFYALLHFMAFQVLLLELNFANLGKEIIERPYITAGFLALLLMTPLAVTSTNKMVRRLGRRWAQLHRLVYLVAIAALVHLAWIAKASYTEAFVYGVIFSVLLGFRLLNRRKPVPDKDLQPQAASPDTPKSP